MKTNFDTFRPIGILVGIGGIMWGFYQNMKQNEIAKKLNTSIEELEKKTSVDIQQNVVDEVMRRVVDREVTKAIMQTSDQVRNDIHQKVAGEVRSAVKEEYDKIKSEVADKISDQVANIDEYALKETVTKQAEAKILKKFDGCLDGVLGDYRRQLQNVTKVWDSVADAITPKRRNEGRTMSFSID